MASKAILSAEKTVIDRGIEALIRELGHPDTLKFIKKSWRLKQGE